MSETKQQVYQHNPSIASSLALIQHYRLFYNCVSYTFPFPSVTSLCAWVGVWRVFFAEEGDGTCAGSTTGVNLTPCVERLDDSTWPSLCFSFFQCADNHGSYIFPLPLSYISSWVFLGGWACPPMVFISLYLQFHRPYIINITRTTKPRTHASIHAHALVPSLHPSHTYTHFLQVYILGRSFDSSLLFKFILWVQLSL